LYTYRGGAALRSHSRFWSLAWVWAQPPSRRNPEANQCIMPNGGDLNELYGIPEQIITPFCTQADAGQHWTVAVAWLMATSFERVPAGFEPAANTPLGDFLAKFVALKYVVDPGTSQQQTFVFPKSVKLWTGVLDGLPAINTLTLGSLHPLSIGQHVIEVYWVFNGLHCDGLTADREQNCIPAGETLFREIVFEVRPGHH
jgi:hypothetical protein